MAEVTDVAYANVDNTAVNATIDGTRWFNITLGSDLDQAKEVQTWLDAGGVPSPHVDPFSTAGDTEPSPQVMLMYDHENRLRAIEGQPPLDLVEFVSQKGL